MPMLDVQRRHAEVFRIRLGDKGPKGEPRKLTDAIRVTARSEKVVAAFTAVYGGSVKPWDGGFEAYLPTTELSVMVLPGQSITQWWELYRGSVCERRCDGFTDQLSGNPCMCPPDLDARMAAKNTCRPMTRINVLCPDVEVVGAGSLVSHGMVAAETLPQSIAVAEAALSRGLMVPAMLRVVEHKGKRHFVVPQLEIVGVSLQQLTTGEVSHLALSDGARSEIAPPPVAAIGSGKPDVVGDAPDVPRPPQPPLPGEEAQPPAGSIDWIARINAIPDSKQRGACMKAFRTAFDGTAVPAGREQEASDLVAGFEVPAQEDERVKLRKGLMAQATKAFPDKATRDAQRHAVTYAVLGEHKSSNDMTADELMRVSLWLADVERGVVKVFMRGDVWVVEFNGGEVEVPAEVAA